MNELSPKARALIELSRRSLRPAAGDRERIEAALHAKLGGQATSVEPATRSTSWHVVTGAAIGVCLFGVVALRVLTTEPHQPTSSLPARPAAVVRPAPAPPPSEPLPELPPAAAAPGLAPPHEIKPTAKASPSRTQDRLAIEVELLSRATRALRAGNAKAALEALDQHQRRFPRGTLRQERRIAKARALCALGLVQEGRAELDDLPRDAPATARALKACDP